MDAEMYIELPKEENRSLNSWKKRDPKRRLKAILGPKNTRKRDSFIIQKNCGPDNICIPELSLNVKTNVEKYLLGSGKILELDVSIENNAEDAFEAVFYLKLPVGIDYINSESQSDSSEIIIQCSAPKLSNENNLRCDVGNPLPYGQIIKFKIYLQPITFHGMKPSYELNMKINSTNPEKPDTLWNNVFNVSLPVWIETDLQIEGESKPQEIDFNSVDYANIEPAILANTLEYGPIITHNYTIRNNGPSTVLNISTSLIWAAETRKTGDILLYLIEQPETSDKKVRCDSANADYLSFKDGQKIRKAIKNESESNLFRRSIFERPLLYVKKINTKALGISSSKDFEPDFELNSNRHSSMLEVNTQDVDIFKRKDHFKREIIKRENQNDLNKIHYLPEQSDEKYNIPLIFNNELLCENAHCVNLQCHVGPLQKDEEVSIAVRYRINVESLKANTKSEKIEVPTKLFAYVTSQPFIGEPTERILRSYEIKTLIQPLANIASADFIPLWIVVLSACIGTTILLLLVYLLYKVCV